MFKRNNKNPVTFFFVYGRLRPDFCVSGDTWNIVDDVCRSTPATTTGFSLYEQNDNGQPLAIENRKERHVLHGYLLSWSSPEIFAFNFQKMNRLQGQRNPASRRAVVTAIGEGLPAPVKAYIYYRKMPTTLSANYTWLPSGDWLELRKMRKTLPLKSKYEFETFIKRICCKDSLVNWHRHPSLLSAQESISQGISIRRFKTIFDLNLLRSTLGNPQNTSRHVGCVKVAFALLVAFRLVSPDEEEDEQHPSRTYQRFSTFIKRRDFHNLLLRYDPLLAIDDHQAMAMYKICQDPHTSPRNVRIEDEFMAMVSHWLRAVINHWIWGAPSCRREWSRVFMAGYNAKELILAPEVGTEAKALSEWFLRNPGCVRLIGGIMLRYFRESVIDDLTYLETTE